MLARTLRQIATDATSDPGEGLSGAELLVGTDLFLHAPTTVSAIASRTGVVQSQVSKIVAAMRDEDIIASTRDPNDRRRSLLHVAPKARERFGTARGSRSPRSAIKASLQNARQPASEGDIDAVLDLMEQLAFRLGGKDLSTSRA